MQRGGRGAAGSGERAADVDCVEDLAELVAVLGHGEAPGGGTRRVRLVREEVRGVSSQNVSDALRDSQEGWGTTSACLYGITRKRISPRVLEGTHLERLRRARALVGDRDRRRDQLRVDDTPLGARALGAGAER